MQYNIHSKKSNSIFEFLLPYKLTLFLAVSCILTSIVVALSIPNLLGSIIDKAFSKAGQSTVYSQLIVQQGLLIFFLLLVNAFSTGFYTYLTGWMGARMSFDLRSKIFGRLIYASQDFYNQESNKVISSRLMADVMNIQSVFTHAVVQFVSQTFLSIGSLFLMLKVNSAAASAIILITPVGVTATMLLSRKLRSLSANTQTATADAARFADQRLEGVKIVQIFNKQAEEIRLYKRKLHSLFNFSLESIKINSILSGISILISFGSILALFIISSYQISAGRLSAGGLASLFFYSSQFGGSVAAAITAFLQIHIAIGSSKELMRIFSDSNVPANSKANRPEIKGDDLKISNLFYSLENKMVLRNVNMDIRKGQLTAIVGQSGTGKSTLFNLILRFLDYSEGDIRIDGVSIKDIHPDILRSKISLVEQDVFLFNDSVENNIRYGNDSCSIDDIINAAEMAGIHQFISELEHGYATILSDGGNNLSGGQRQRIAIARAIAKNSPILLLDEATSALDSEAESTVLNSLRQLSKNKIVIIITHRQSTIDYVDNTINIVHKEDYLCGDEVANLSTCS